MVIITQINIKILNRKGSTRQKWYKILLFYKLVYSLINLRLIYKNIIVYLNLC